MKLTKSDDTRICNNCFDILESRLFDIEYGKDRLSNRICLCVKCLDELRGLIGELELFK